MCLVSVPGMIKVRFSRAKDFMDSTNLSNFFYCSACASLHFHTWFSKYSTCAKGFARKFAFHLLRLPWSIPNFVFPQKTHRPKILSMVFSALENSREKAPRDCTINCCLCFAKWRVSLNNLFLRLGFRALTSLLLFTYRFEFVFSSCHGSNLN